MVCEKFEFGIFHCPCSLLGISDGRVISNEYRTQTVRFCSYQPYVLLTLLNWSATANAKNFLSRKITVRFKLNLKTDGPDHKKIFKFGKRLERFHSARKQCRRIYICELVGARPLHLLSQTVLSLKSPTGAFIAALRSANANFALQNTCWGHPNP